MSDLRDDLLKQLGVHGRERQEQEATQPLGDAFHAAMAAQIEEQLAADAAGDTPAGRRWWGAGLALAASVVAAVLLLVSLGPPGDTPVLPAYVADLRGGATVRSADSGAAFDVGDRFDLVLRPATAVKGPLRIVAFERTGGALTAIDLPTPQWSADGAARLVATVSDGAPFTPGVHDLVLVVAHAAYVPDARQVRGALAHSGRGGAFHAVQVRVEVAAP